MDGAQNEFRFALRKEEIGTLTARFFQRASEFAEILVEIAPLSAEFLPLGRERSHPFNPSPQVSESLQFGMPKR